MNRITLTVSILPLSFLSACSPPYSEPFTGPNGRMAFSMNCSDIGQSIEKCYADASVLCPTGYDIIDSRSDIIGMPVAGGGMIVGAEKTLVIECKA